MKKSLLLIMSIIFATALIAQDRTGKTETKYRRSSLHTILIESDDFPRKETVLTAYYNAPFPDKYNDHTIGEKSFDPKKLDLYELNLADTDVVEAYVDAKIKEELNIGNMMKKAASNSTGGILKNDKNEIPNSIERFFKQRKVANKMVAKWFGRQEDGSFNMNLIAERGFYDATEMQANIAKGSARGTSSLGDAGEELIKNTFVTVSKLNFVSNEVVARTIRDVAKARASAIPSIIVRKAALLAADKVYDKTKEGYSVWTTAYLYQLNWNDSIAAVFYNDLWMDKSNIDPERKEAFDNTDLFELKFIGDEKARSLVTFSLKKGKRTEEEIIKIATVRNIDAVYAKLQKKYDVFKTKTPLYSGYPITAKIGMKEGLEANQKYEVLEQTMDPKTGLTKYVSKGTIKVDGSSIWDNRYSAGEEAHDAENTKKAEETLTSTTFKGGKKFYAGMLIRQIK